MSCPTMTVALTVIHWIDPLQDEVWSQCCSADSFTEDFDIRQSKVSQLW